MRGRILVVDDLAESRYMVRSLLQGHDFEVCEAQNGKQALAAAHQSAPDAVVADLLMPEMDGFAFCRAWMMDERLWPIPFIVHTATYTDAKDRQLVLDMGAAEFIEKPAEPEELLRIINKVLHNRQRLHSRPQGPPDGDFFERYSERLREKLDSKIRSLAAAEEKLSNHVMRCEAILDASPIAIVCTDCDLRIRTWNFAAERLFGYSEAEAMDQSIAMIIPAEEMEEELRILAEARGRQGIILQESRRLRKDGICLEVEISTAFLGSDIGYARVCADLSAIRQTVQEKRRLEEQLALAQRMESVGQLAGGVAHDFNNLLTVILAHAGFLESGLDPAGPLCEDAKRIREAGESAAMLTRQLLAFSRRQTIRPAIVNLNDTMLAMEKMLARLIGEDIELHVDAASDLGHIEADVSQLQQVILNLAANARDAMPAGGSLTLGTRNVVVGHQEALNNPPMHPGRFVVLTVTDTGMGMDEETRAHAFEPFFTTKARGKGTGLGLATVYGIIKQSNGFVWIDSEAGNGAVFRVYFPRVDRPLSEDVPADPRKANRARGETILVVEDDEMVRALVQRILTKAGYRVLPAVDGEDALALAQRTADSIDLLLTDVVMPKMNGRELAQRMESVRPSLKVVFTSGYDDDAIAKHGILERGVCLVEKPFRAEVLLAMIRAVLDGKEPGFGQGN